MNGRSNPTRVLDVTETFPPTEVVADRDALPLKLTASAGALPRLTGEIRDLVHARLREVALLISVGWSLVLSLCLSGRDGVFDIPRLGVGCVATVGFAVIVFAASGLSLRGLPRQTLARLRGYEAVYLWGSVGCAAWLRIAAVGHALDSQPIDRFKILYASAVTNLIWLTVIVIYGIFAPNTWARLVRTTVGVIVLLVAVDVLLWAGRPVASELVISNVLITILSVSLATGMALYGSFKLATAEEEAVVARRQLRDLGQYRLVRRLGAGAMGEVYLAEHVLLRRPCAVKLIRTDQGGAS